MRTLAIILNVAAVLLIIVLIKINTENLSDAKMTAWLIVIAVFAFLIFNIVVFALPYQSWLARFFERKKLEEVKRIKALEKEIKEHHNSN